MVFGQTIGQEKIKHAIEQRLKTRQTPHAQCFVDKGGRGGLALALDCAFSLLYDEIPDSLEKAVQHPDLQFVYPVSTSVNVKTKPLCSDYLDQWRSFLETNIYGNLSDWLFQIGSENKQGNIGVEETEALFKSLSLKAYLGKNKVCVFWGVERLNIQAANKLLKLIEEPPLNTYFLLVIDDDEKLLPTIKSRCQMIVLPPLDTLSVKTALVNYGCSTELAEAISENAEGNLQWAKQQTLDQENTASIEAMLIDCLRCAFRASGNKSISIDLMQWANRAGQMGRPTQKAFLHFGLRFLRQAMLISFGGKHLVTYHSLNSFSMEKFAPYVHSKNIAALITLFESSLYAVDRNANGKILFTDFCLQLTRLLKIKE